MPSFRSMSNFTLFHLQEPIGGAKPKFSSAIDGLIVGYALRQFIALTCPAQGFPLPGFRLVNQLMKSGARSTHFRHSAHMLHYCIFYTRADRRLKTTVVGRPELESTDEDSNTISRHDLPRSGITNAIV